MDINSQIVENSLEVCFWKKYKLRFIWFSNEQVETNYFFIKTNLYKQIKFWHDFILKPTETKAKSNKNKSKTKVFKLKFFFIPKKSNGIA